MYHNDRTRTKLQGFMRWYDSARRLSVVTISSLAHCCGRVYPTLELSTCCCQEGRHGITRTLTGDQKRLGELFSHLSPAPRTKLPGSDMSNINIQTNICRMFTSHNASALSSFSFLYSLLLRSMPSQRSYGSLAAPTEQNENRRKVCSPYPDTSRFVYKYISRNRLDDISISATRQQLRQY